MGGAEVRSMGNLMESSLYLWEGWAASGTIVSSIDGSSATGDAIWCDSCCVCWRMGLPPNQQAGMDVAGSGG